LGGFGGDSHREGTCWCRYEASDFVFVVCFGLNFMNVRDLQRVGEREREREREPFCGGWGSNTIKSPDSHNTPQLDYVLAEAGRVAGLRSNACEAISLQSAMHHLISQ
jgi:hypothetical protein